MVGGLSVILTRRCRIARRPWYHSICTDLKCSTSHIRHSPCWHGGPSSFTPKRYMRALERPASGPLKLKRCRYSPLVPYPPAHVQTPFFSSRALRLRHQRLAHCRFSPSIEPSHVLCLAAAAASATTTSSPCARSRKGTPQEEASVHLNSTRM